MGEFRQLINRKINLLESAPEMFTDSTRDAQKRIYRRILDLAAQLDVDAAGNIRQTNENVRRINQIVESLSDEIFRGEYEKSMNAYIRSYSETASIDNSYFRNAFGQDFTFKSFYDTITKQAQENVLGQLGRNGIDVNFMQPMKKILNQAVTSGQKFGDAVDSLKLFIQGDGIRLGRFESYVKQIAHDGLAQFNASYTQAIAKDIDVQWYHYVGGLIKDSREFCQAAVKKQWFNITEIEDLPIHSQKILGVRNPWDGQIPGTNPGSIITYRGGYNCAHEWMPVAEAFVPR